MSDDLRRLSNALERAGEDLATARVLVDTALRQLQTLLAIPHRSRYTLRGQDWHFVNMSRSIHKQSINTAAGLLHVNL
jgi:hypothetical protein